TFEDTLSCVIATQPRRSTIPPIPRLNRAPKPEDADEPAADDQFVARAVHHLLRGDWRKHFLSADRESLARVIPRIDPRFGRRLDRPLTQRRFTASVFVIDVRSFTRFGFR